MGRLALVDHDSVNPDENLENVNKYREGAGTEQMKSSAKSSLDEDDLDEDEDDDENDAKKRAEAEEREALKELQANSANMMMSDEEDDIDLDEIDNILELAEERYPRFTLAKNKARFLRMVSWYRGKEEWIEVAPLSGVTKLFKTQTKELEGIRSSKLDYEMELETGTLTPSQRSYRRDELKMCKVQEKMAVHLISKLQVKIKSGRR